MVKELAEDIRRYMADREINARLVLVFDHSTKTFVQRPWRDVKVSNHTLLCKHFECICSLSSQQIVCLMIT